MSAERTACNQFNQHAWKKDICTNCSKPLSCHNGTSNFQSSPLKANVNPAGNAANVSNEGDATKLVSLSTKPSKPKKPSFAQSDAPKCLTNNKDNNTATKANNDGKTNSVQGLKTNCSFDKPQGNSNYYQIYDVTAKGQSGKPLDLDSQDDDSSYERDMDPSNACLMATPYTVVDVITMALEKSRQSGQTCSNPPCLPSTPAPELRKNLSTKIDLANIKKEESKQLIKEEITDKNSEDLDSSCHFRPRLYEEIDESFMERVASKKLEINSSDENSCQLPNEENKTIIAKSVESSDSKLLELKTIVKQEKSKKSGKSFFQKLLGKGNKEEESCKIKVEKNGKRESSVDGKSMASSEEDARKSSESLLVEFQSKKEVEVEDGAFESSSVPEMLSQSSCIGEDFAKEIEEKFETLSRKSNLNKSAMMRSISNKVENPFDSNEKHQMMSPTLENMSSINEGVSTLPNRKSVLQQQSTKKADSLNNRKSMTPAEAKLARKMLVAPPPPPICTSSTSLASSSSHSASKDDISSCLNKPPPTCFMSLQRKSDLSNVLAGPQSPGEDVFESSEIMNRDSLMDDLDEILKKGGMTQGAASTLPKSFLHTHDKTTVKPKVAPGHISSKEVSAPSINAVQQRALPDLPQLPPPTARLHKINLSPDSENVYEILPLSEDLSSPKKLNLISTKSEKTLSRFPVKFDEIINASQSFKSDSDQVSNRPRPAPRAAIRAVGITKAKDIDMPLKTPEESYANANENKFSNKPRNSTESLRLDESLEEKCSIISRASVKSLQIYLEKFCTPVLAFNFCTNMSWKEREAEVVTAAECKSSVLSWMKAVFYEITTGDMNCILMVRRSSVITSPLPKYNHPNLMSTLHSFEAEAELPDCLRFFQVTNEQDRNAGKAKYIFDILPYSKILAFPLLPQYVANSSSIQSPLLCNDISKYKAYVMLQIFDSLLQLQRLGIDLYRLYPSDILLAAPLCCSKSSRHAEKERCLLPILVPTEYAEHSPRNDQKLLCHDLAKIAALVMSSTKTPKDLPLGIKHLEDEKVLTCQMRTQLPQPRTRHTSISLDKNDRCLRKVERIMATSDSWSQVEIAKNYLEISLWGPNSEEEVRLALTSLQRRQICYMWLGISCSDVLVTLMENNLAYNMLQASSLGTNINSNPEDTVKKNCSQESPIEFTVESWFAVMETLRKAEFLVKCDLEMLLISAKELFF